MDTAVGTLVQAFAALLVIAFYLLVGGVILAVCWAAFQRVSGHDGAHSAAEKDRMPHPR